mmetsp:Transcript_13118/g.17584  ORF Transcript_13118/g.17584 Transcript_13118/m.17584 type:complete len:135 (+) Transcript_13118:481-885(+)
MNETSDFILRLLAYTDFVLHPRHKRTSMRTRKVIAALIISCLHLLHYYKTSGANSKEELYSDSFSFPISKSSPETNGQKWEFCDKINQSYQFHIVPFYDTLSPNDGIYETGWKQRILRCSVMLVGCWIIMVALK